MEKTETYLLADHIYQMPVIPQAVSTIAAKFEQFGDNPYTNKDICIPAISVLAALVDHGKLRLLLIYNKITH